MATCPKLSTCRLMSTLLAEMPAVGGVYQRLYCHACFQACARLWVLRRLGEQGVPPSLFPFESSRAESIVRQG